jgi:membrane-associated protein
VSAPSVYPGVMGVWPCCFSVTGMVSGIATLLVAIGHTPWAYLVMAGILVVDGFFPFVPGETAVVTLSTLVAAAGGAQLWIVLLVAVAATMTGDAVSFVFGRRVGLNRWRWMRGPRMTAIFARGASGLARRPGLVLTGAKFLPFVRVAVTMTAGAGGLEVRRYLPRSFIASTLYTFYHVAIGAAAGFWFAVNPLVAALIAIATVFALGFAFARIAKLRETRVVVLPEPGEGP